MAANQGPTGISPAMKDVALAIVTVVGGFLGFLTAQPVVTYATVAAAVVYVIPTVISELEGA